MRKNKSQLKNKQNKNPSDCLVMEGKELLNPFGDDVVSKLREAMRDKPLEVRTLQK